MNSLRHLLCTGAVLAPVVAWDFANPHDFESIVAKNEHTLVAFIRPELEKCKTLEPEWETATGSQQNLIAIDCAAEAQFCEEQDVASHPAIRAYFPDNTIERYRGPRKAAPMLSFLARISAPFLADLTPANLSSFLASDDVVIVAQASPEDDILLESFENAAHKYHDRYSFGVLLAEGQGHVPVALRCQNNLDRLELSTTELGGVTAVDEFVGRCGARLVGELTRRNEMKYMRRGKSIVMYFTDSDLDREEYVQHMRDLAKKYSEFLAFVTVDTKEYPDMAAGMGHAAGANGVLALQNPHNWQVFPFAGEVSPANVEAFIVEISQGKVKAWDGKVPVEALGKAKSEEAKSEEAKKKKQKKTGGGDRTPPVQGHDEL